MYSGWPLRVLSWRAAFEFVVHASDFACHAMEAQSSNRVSGMPWSANVMVSAVAEWMKNKPSFNGSNVEYESVAS